MIISGFWGVLAGSLLWLDRVFVFQLMFSRPLIIGPIIAFLMGDMKAGILIGASLELLWLNAPPVGSYLPNDESFCTAAAVPVAVLAGSSMDHSAAVGLSIVLSLPISIVGRSLDMHLRNINERLIDPGGLISEKDLAKEMKRAVARSFLAAFVVLSACVTALAVVAHFLGKALPDAALKPLAYIPFTCIIIGLAALVSREMPKKSHVGVFVLGMALVLLLTWIV